MFNKKRDIGVLLVGLQFGADTRQAQVRDREAKLLVQPHIAGQTTIRLRARIFIYR